METRGEIQVKNFFNGTCANCEKFKPRCANVKRPSGERGYKEWWRHVLCEDCRKILRGKYRLAEEHK